MEWKYVEKLEDKNGYIPFAIAEFGDIICINVKNGNIELYNHEMNEFERVCENIDFF